jgi:hypothetical protein
MIVIKTPQELELMRKSNRLVAEALYAVKKLVAEGVTTESWTGSQKILSAGAVLCLRLKAIAGFRHACVFQSMKRLSTVYQAAGNCMTVIL